MAACCASERAQGRRAPARQQRRSCCGSPLLGRLAACQARTSDTGTCQPQTASSPGCCTAGTAGGRKRGGGGGVVWCGGEEGGAGTSAAAAGQRLAAAQASREPHGERSGGGRSGGQGGRRRTVPALRVQPLVHEVHWHVCPGALQVRHWSAAGQAAHCKDEPRKAHWRRKVGRAGLSAGPGLGTQTQQGAGLSSTQAARQPRMGGRTVPALFENPGAQVEHWQLAAWSNAWQPAVLGQAGHCRQVRGEGGGSRAGPHDRPGGQNLGGRASAPLQSSSTGPHRVADELRLGLALGAHRAVGAAALGAVGDRHGAVGRIDGVDALQAEEGSRTQREGG